MSQWIAQQLLVALLTTSAVVALALALLSRWRDPVARHRVLVCFLPVLVALVPLQLLTSELGPVRTSPDSAPPNATATSRASAPRSARHAWDSAEGSIVGPGGGAEPLGPQLPGAATWLNAVRHWLAPAYALGAALLLLGVTARGIQTARLLRTCRAVREPRVIALWRSLLAGARGTSRTALLQSARARAPGCWGLWRASVVVPSTEIRRADLERLGLVLRHELVHVARRDVPFSVVQQLARALLWFNPLVWIYSLLLSRYRELSCDAIVLRQTGKHQTYALTLLEYCRARGPFPGVLMAGRGTRSEIRRRLNMILQMQENARTGTTAPRWMLGAAAALALGGSVVAAAVLGPGALPPGQPQAQPTTKPEPQKDTLPGTRLKFTEEGMTTEAPDGSRWRRIDIDGPPGERSAAAVLHLHEMLMRQGAAQQPLPREGTLTEQETLLSGERVRVLDNVLLARELVVNMPEGSQLRSELLAKDVTLHRPDKQVVLDALEGQLRLADNKNVVRLLLHAARAGELEVKPKFEKSPDGAGATIKLEVAPPPDVTLRITVEVDKGEVTMRIRATKPDGSPAQVQAELDLKTGVPQEKDPPDGSVLYKLLPPKENDAAGLVRVKMQWVHDMSKAGKEGDNKNQSEQPKERPKNVAK